MEWPKSTYASLSFLFTGRRRRVIILCFNVLPPLCNEVRVRVRVRVRTSTRTRAGLAFYDEVKLREMMGKTMEMP